MPQFRGFGVEERPPTWAEREFQRQLRETGVADVLLEPEQTPPEFWQTVVQAVEAFAGDPRSSVWITWSDEIRWSFGWREFAPGQQGFSALQQIVRSGIVPLTGKVQYASVGERLAAIEHLLDVLHHIEDLIELINNRAHWFRVGLRIEGRRFVAVTQEHLHEVVVQPTLLLLANPDLTAVDKLYRKAFDRALTNDASGAITVANSAVEEMLGLGLALTGSDLGPLVGKAGRWLDHALGWGDHREAHGASARERRPPGRYVGLRGGDVRSPPHWRNPSSPQQDFSGLALGNHRGSATPRGDGGPRSVHQVGRVPVVVPDEGRGPLQFPGPGRPAAPDGD